MTKLIVLNIVFCFLLVKSVNASNNFSLPDTLKKAESGNSPSNKNESNKWIMFEHSTKVPSVDSVVVLTSDSLTNKEVVKDKLKRRKKIISTLLAFPLPCGVVGLHRIYLGTKPYVPLVYIATFGGAAGIVPFIDFVVLLLEKDISKYENNPNIIMWAN